MNWNLPITREELEASPYYVTGVDGDALEQSGLSAITAKGTFPYPEAVNIRRTPSLSSMQISMLPFRSASRTVHTPVKRSAAIV